MCHRILVHTIQRANIIYFSSVVAVFVQFAFGKFRSDLYSSLVLVVSNDDATLQSVLPLLCFVLELALVAFLKSLPLLHPFRA